MPTRFIKKAFLLLSTSLLTLASYQSQAQGPTIDPTFQPSRIFVRYSSGTTSRGTVNDVVRQPDGKYIIGGDFTEVNGVPALNLARLNADGTPDVAYTAACRVNDQVLALALQSDGKVLVGGRFTTLAGNNRLVLGRLQTDGTIDESFAPPTLPLTPTNRPQVKQIVLRPDGRILVVGTFNVRGASAEPQSLVQLLSTTGQEDASFRYISGIQGASTNQILLQPDGKVVIAINNTSTYNPYIHRILSDGTLDGSFTPLGDYFVQSPNVLAIDKENRIYIRGLSYLQRLLPNGRGDNTFPISSYLGSPTHLVIQPNGRLLINTVSSVAFPNPPPGTRSLMSRLLDNGTSDPSFVSAYGPLDSSSGLVSKILVQPDGAIIAAGSFEQVGTNTGISGLVRLLDTNVLRVASSETAARTAAWPVPAHDELHLQLEAKARPQHVSLIDALGKVVHSQAITQPELTVSTAALAAGVYMLRVQYAEGMVTRRIAVQ
ncbi:T9SS type A sorting domain-containing protein [Hymenobacter cavernae]|nr:T9SS type A sorting domain-containing protein [Hymenobacter cavernae]